MSPVFSLQAHQVPGPPSGSESDVDWLRWLIAVMNPNDPSLAFVASLLSHAASRGSLTDRQFSAVERILQRVHSAYVDGALYCQKNVARNGDIVPFRPRVISSNDGGMANEH